jgi:6-phosphogluconolactonase
VKLEVVETLDSAAALASEFIAREITGAVQQRGRCAIAVSGGGTPAPMFDHLAKAKLPWEAVHLFQVDERVAPDASEDRNVTLLRRHLLSSATLPAANLHLMPVGLLSLQEAANRYTASLRAVCGDPPVLDVVHLGIGADGHTASLFPGDPGLDVADADVVATAQQAGWERLTLTVPALRRARTMLWLIAGAEKATALRDLMERADIPAARVARDDTVIYADRAAAALISG